MHPLLKALRLVLLAVGLMAVSLRAAPFPYAEWTIDRFQEEMAAGRLTAHDLTDAYLRRIAELDRTGPNLHAVIELNPDALAIATQLDAERKAGHVRGPLHGIPVLIKDNIDTADRMETTAGSLALVGCKPAQDAPLVRRLRAAGAVILGKTNLSEWANFRSTSSSSGWSGRGGQTRNPYALDRSPIGSSSGSAVATAANLCAVAVGTETDGSIIAPASACGVVGVKPTVGLISGTGIIPISPVQDTAGPMARSVRDAAILLSVLAERAGAAPGLPPRPAELSLDYAAALKPGALHGARVGILYGPFGFGPRMSAVLYQVVTQLNSAGAEVVDLGEYKGLAKMNDPELEALLYEFKPALNAYLASLGSGSPMKSMADLIHYDVQHADREMPYFDQELFLQAQAKGPLTDAAYVEARKLCTRIARTEGIDAFMAKDHLDALVALSIGPAWLIDHVNGDGNTGGSTSLAAVAGYPSVTVPATQVAGLPIGVSFIGSAWTEGKLLALAADFEAQTHARRAPELPAHAKVGDE